MTKTLLCEYLMQHHLRLISCYINRCMQPELERMRLRQQPHDKGLQCTQDVSSKQPYITYKPYAGRVISRVYCYGE